MNRTKIEWVKNPDGSQGYTWNPITGCLNGCSYCYARRLANGRLRTRYLANSVLPTHDEPDHEAHHNDPFYPRFWPERLDDLRTWTPAYMMPPRGIFVCDMGELFGDWVPSQWQETIFEAIKNCPQHRFYLLTKQPQNLPKFSPFPLNCYVGVTVTNDSMMSAVVKAFDDMWSSVKFISFEPLLGQLSKESLKQIRDYVCQWIIIGAQTKPYLAPQSELIGEIVSAADHAGIPVFLKDNLYMIKPKRQEMP